jgi:hypothetical protein
MPPSVSEEYGGDKSFEPLGREGAMSSRGEPQATGAIGTAVEDSKVFTAEEKRGLLVGEFFRSASLDGVDFSGADLKSARFEHTSLRDCDFSATHLQDTFFLDCDLRGASFAGATFEGNRFDGSLLQGATGLSESQRSYIAERGGSYSPTEKG